MQTVSGGFVLTTVDYYYCADVRRLKQIVATRALPNSKAVEPESGTVPTRENASLKVGGVVPPTMSVPSRNQSGSRFALRIQACKSPVKIGADRGVESHKKLPDESPTCGTKK